MVKLNGLKNKSKPSSNGIKKILKYIPNKIYSMTNSIHYKLNYKYGCYYNIV